MIKIFRGRKGGGPCPRRKILIIHGGGRSLIKATGVRHQSLIWVQQLKMLIKTDTKFNFWHPREDTIPHFDSPREDK